MEARNLVIHLENSEVEDMSQQGVHVVAPVSVRLTVSEILQAFCCIASSLSD